MHTQILPQMNHIGVRLFFSFNKNRKYYGNMLSIEVNMIRLFNLLCAVWSLISCVHCIKTPFCACETHLNLNGTQSISRNKQKTNAFLNCESSKGAKQSKATTTKKKPAEFYIVIIIYNKRIQKCVCDWPILKVHYQIFNGVESYLGTMLTHSNLQAICCFPLFLHNNKWAWFWLSKPRENRWLRRSTNRFAHSCRWKWIDLCIFCTFSTLRTTKWKTKNK